MATTTENKEGKALLWLPSFVDKAKNFRNDKTKKQATLWKLVRGVAVQRIHGTSNNNHNKEYHLTNSNDAILFLESDNNENSNKDDVKDKEIEEADNDNNLQVNTNEEESANMTTVGSIPGDSTNSEAVCLSGPSETGYAAAAMQQEVTTETSAPPHLAETFQDQLQKQLLFVLPTSWMQIPV